MSFCFLCVFNQVTLIDYHSDFVVSRVAAEVVLLVSFVPIVMSSKEFSSMVTVEAQVCL